MSHHLSSFLFNVFHNNIKSEVLEPPPLFPSPSVVENESQRNIKSLALE